MLQGKSYTKSIIKIDGNNNIANERVDESANLIENVNDQSCETNDDYINNNNNNNELFTFLKNSIIEPVALVIAFSTAIKNVVKAALIQDKICLQKFSFSDDFCKNIANEEGPMKDEVLKASASIVTMKELLILLPIIINAIYIGSWCDRYCNGKRYCLIGNCISLIMESFLLFLNAYFFDAHYVWSIIMFLPPAFFGSSFGVTTTIYSYISHMHSENDRNMRFIIYQICNYFGTAAGNFFSAFLLPKKPILTGHQLQNYTGVFIASTSGYILVLIWTILFVKKDEITENNVSTCNVRRTINDSSTLPLISSNNKKEITKCKWNFFYVISDIFDLSHIRDVYVVMVKKRVKYLRCKLWLLIANLNLILLAYYSINVAFPFVQKVYNWDAVYFSLASTANSLLRPISLLLFMPFILKLIKLSDLEIALLGILSSFLGLIIVGSITSSVGIWLQMIFGSISALGSTGTRAYISRVLPRDEVSRIFGVIITIEASQPFLSALFYNSIFNFSITWYPTLAFHAAAGISIVSLMIVVYVDLIDRFELTLTKM